jgi:hypothetical protein
VIGSGIGEGERDEHGQVETISINLLGDFRRAVARFLSLLVKIVSEVAGQTNGRS